MTSTLKITHRGRTYSTSEPCCGGPALGTNHAPDCQAMRDLEEQALLHTLYPRDQVLDFLRSAYPDLGLCACLPDRQDFTELEIKEWLDKIDVWCNVSLNFNKKFLIWLYGEF